MSRYGQSDAWASLLPAGALVRVPRVGDLRRGRLSGILRAGPLPVLVPRRPRLRLRDDALGRGRGDRTLHQPQTALEFGSAADGRLLGAGFA